MTSYLEEGSRKVSRKPKFLFYAMTVDAVVVKTSCPMKSYPEEGSMKMS